MFQGNKEKKQKHVLPPQGGRKEGIIMKKYCTKCGKEFEAVGREVICPVCKQAAAEESKKAAVLRAKRASWNGESVPVRISGRASTVIRRYGAANGLPFVAALDELLKSSDYFKDIGVKWENIEPYKSHRRDKGTATSTATSTAETVQDTASKPQGVQDATSKPQEVKQDVQATQEVQAAKESKTVKTSTSKTVKTTGKAASKTGRGGKA